MERTTREAAYTLILENRRIGSITELYERGRITRRRAIELLRESQAKVTEALLDAGELELASRSAMTGRRLDRIAAGTAHKGQGYGTN